MMIRSVAAFAAAGISLVLAACASANGPPFAPASVPAGEGAVYIYKQPGQIPAAVGLAMTIDGRSISELRNQGYLVATLKPGPHTLALDEKAMDLNTPSYIPFTFQTDAGKAQYIDVLWVANASFANGGGGALLVSKGPDLVTFRAVLEADALKILAGLKLSTK